MQWATALKVMLTSAVWSAFGAHRGRHLRWCGLSTAPEGLQEDFWWLIWWMPCDLWAAG